MLNVHTCTCGLHVTRVSKKKTRSWCTHVDMYYTYVYSTTCMYSCSSYSTYKHYGVATFGTTKVPGSDYVVLDSQNLKYICSSFINITCIEYLYQ